MFMRNILGGFGLAACLPIGGAAAQTADVDALIALLRIDDTVAIMRAEGQRYADDLAQDMFGGANASWQDTVDAIYDPSMMTASVSDTFRASIDPDAVGPLLEFFGSDLGREVVALEIGAREALLDEGVEEAARAEYRELTGTGDSKLQLIERFIETNDLIEQNVTGALNASYAFYSGLADGGALEMSEAEMLDDIWSQEEATRTDTEEWVWGYLMMAYGPLSEEALERYVTLSESEPGEALNKALFAGFNRMYDEISYAMGLGAAAEMAGTDL
ncbi:hypothetical protein SAMN05421759_1074 [Roseivivax lentus]|uniref:Uncharacterized protein n=1 Tax=Roseivivax lentus TaxID=633194 RepID=A0A1N7N5P0_9RHOB|nr:DUF2059 domain-containing protein [Roseivivax lentus]SIS93665.1 hypothetical protein SAMN05421759_1074 [Roseivivax lentus]